MTRNSERDESIDKLLRGNFRTTQGSGRASGTCVEPEVIAAWTEGRLRQEEAARVETHLASCDACQEVLAVFARTEPMGVASQTLWQRWRLQWAVPLAAAATAVAIWVASPSPEDRRAGNVPSSEVAIPPSVSTEPTGSVSAVASAPAGEQKRSPEKKEPLEREGATQALSSLEARQEKPSRADEVDRFKAASAPESAARDRDTKEEREAPRQTAAAPPAGAASARQQTADAATQTGLLRQATAIEIVSPNALNRWRLLPGGGVERSTTGGKTWEPAAIEAPAALTAGMSPDPLVCWLVGPGGYITRTVDGVRFQRVPFPLSAPLVAVRADSASAATVTTADGRQFRTENQGTTWSQVTP